MVKMPILLAGHTMNPAAVIRPLAMGQQWRADSLSTASMELDDESPEVAIGDWIKLYAPNGMSGVFYVKGIKQDKVTLSCELFPPKKWSQLEDAKLKDESTKYWWFGPAELKELYLRERASEWFAFCRRQNC